MHAQNILSESTQARTVVCEYNKVILIQTVFMKGNIDYLCICQLVHSFNNWHDLENRKTASVWPLGSKMFKLVSDDPFVLTSNTIFWAFEWCLMIASCDLCTWLVSLYHFKGEPKKLKRCSLMFSSILENIKGNGSWRSIGKVNEHSNF